MNNQYQTLLRWVHAAAVIAAAVGCGAAQAQDNVLKVAVTRITNHSSTNGVSGVGVPPGADAKAGDATAATFVLEHLFTPNIGAEIVLGTPPRIHSDAAGSVSYLGKDVLSAETLAPTAFVNYHFGDPGDRLRPYLGIGANYTRFVKARSTLSADPKLGDSYGLAAQVGVDYAFDKTWGLFASVAKLDVKSRVVAAGNTVLTTTIDFRPITYTAGLTYRF